jgi:hypothetical protein
MLMPDMREEPKMLLKPPPTAERVTPPTNDECLRVMELGMREQEVGIQFTRGRMTVTTPAGKISQEFPIDRGLMKLSDDCRKLIQIRVNKALHARATLEGDAS